MAKVKGDLKRIGDNWVTPPHILELARALFKGPIANDPFSNEAAQIHVRAARYFTMERPYEPDRASLLRLSSVWINPPYSNPGLGVKVFMNCKSGCLLVPNSMETEWWYNAFIACRCVCFISKRLSFLDPRDLQPKFPARQGSCLFYKGHNENAKYLMGQYGLVWRR